MSSALNKAFNDKIVVTELGKTLTGVEAFVQSLVDHVLQGDSKAIPELMRLFTKTKMFKPVPDPPGLPAWSWSRQPTNETKSWANWAAFTKSGTEWDFMSTRRPKRLAPIRREVCNERRD
jgi:hypothetical protein